MCKVFVDFEMQPIQDRKVRKVCSDEIIEIGAVMLDQSNSEISNYKRYVKPQYSKGLSRGIIELTGITNGKISGAGNFVTVIENFAAWCFSKDEKVMVYAWSDSDFVQVTKEIALKEMIPSGNLLKLLNAWIDYQKVFDDLVGAVQPVSLDRALAASGLTFDGKRHDALYDARNTAALYGMTQDVKTYKKMREQMKIFLNHEDEPLTLGDLIDFNALKMAVA